MVGAPAERRRGRRCHHGGGVGRGRGRCAAAASGPRSRPTSTARGSRAAAAGAERLAATGPEALSPLPEPAPGRAHEGYDPAAVAVDPAEAGAALDEWGRWRAAAARTAIVSTKGVRAYEERSFGDLRVRRHAGPGRSLELTATAVRPGELDPRALAAEADELLGAGDAVHVVEPGEYAVVLGPWAVAELLRRAALSFGGPASPLSDRLGALVAAATINLSESPRFAATLPRSYDAEGSPRQPMPLIQDGVAHRLAGLGTGHAQAAGGGRRRVPRAPRARRRRGGGSRRAGRADRRRPADPGAVAARRLDGRPARLGDGRGRARDPRAASPPSRRRTSPCCSSRSSCSPKSRRSTARQRTIPPPLQRSARTASATVAPALRAAGGLHVAGPA